LAGNHLQFGINTPAIYLIFLDIFRNPSIVIGIGGTVARRLRSSEFLQFA
jgi:hypothetical protein